MVSIANAVGKGCKNNSIDVKKIQTLLNASPLITPKIAEDGKYGRLTFQAILKVQLSIFHQTQSADGVVSPNGKTLGALNSRHARPVRTVTMDQVKSREVALGGYIGATAQSKPLTFGKLTEADFQGAAETLGSDIEVAMVKAFAEVESGGRSGFGASGFPKIAFEGHIFQQLTKKAYDKTHPLLSYTYVKKAGPEWQKNNKDDSTALETLKAAMKLNQGAAYQACSWGMFQILGKNYKMCGYSSVDAFVADMKSGEKGQLKVFVEFCKNTPGLKAALASKDYKECAILYNGKNYGDYDERIRKAYKKYSGI